MSISLCSCLFGFSQSDQKINRSTLNKSGIESCDKGTKQAIADSENKIYKYYSYGMVVRSKEELKFRTFYKKYMHSKYGIVLGDAGCVVTAESQCYKEKMFELIQKEFGVEIFETSQEEAVKLYAKTK